jgi:hypothetical protein
VLNPTQPAFGPTGSNSAPLTLGLVDRLVLLTRAAALLAFGAAAIVVALLVIVPLALIGLGLGIAVAVGWWVRARWRMFWAGRASAMDDGQGRHNVRVRRPSAEPPQG